MNLKQELKKYFGFENFRPGQKEIIEQIMSNRDVLAVLPTGGGKSLLYQLPAILKDGVAIVVSPLIALMADQIYELEKKGLPATFINSTLSSKERRNRIKNLIDGEYKMLYVSPETLNNESFLYILNDINISFMAIDEAHLISHWGHEFRPAYRRLKKIKNALNNPTVAAFTATATEKVRYDIIQQLDMDNPFIKVSGFDRPELKLNGEFFYYLTEKNEAFYNYIYSIYEKKNCFPPMIIYCGSRKDCEVISKKLNKKIKNKYKIENFSLPYHADMTKKKREEVQNAFMEGDIACIVGTIAFGMGINKSNIRHVIHYTIPGSVESYYQEVGRAGRDGKNSECVLFYYPNDIRLREYLNNISHPPKLIFQRTYTYLLRNLEPGVTIKKTYAQIALSIGSNKLEQAQISTCLTKLKYSGVFKSPKRGYMILSENVKSFNNLGIDFDLILRRKREKERKLEVMKNLVKSKDKRAFILDYFGVDT